MERARIAVAVLALMLLGACQLLESEDGRFAYDSVAIREVVVPDTVATGSEIPVVIQGELPTPAWDLYRVDVERLPKKVIIRPVGRLDREREPVIQVVVAFDDTVHVQLESSGTNEIIVVGSNKTITEPVVVR